MSTVAKPSILRPGASFSKVGVVTGVIRPALGGFADWNGLSCPTTMYMPLKLWEINPEAVPYAPGCPGSNRIPPGRGSLWLFNSQEINSGEPQLGTTSIATVPKSCDILFPLAGAGVYGLVSAVEISTTM